MEVVPAGNDNDNDTGNPLGRSLTHVKHSKHCLADCQLSHHTLVSLKDLKRSPQSTRTRTCSKHHLWPRPPATPCAHASSSLCAHWTLLFCSHETLRLSSARPSLLTLLMFNNSVASRMIVTIFRDSCYRQFLQVQQHIRAFLDTRPGFFDVLQPVLLVSTSCADTRPVQLPPCLMHWSPSILPFCIFLTSFISVTVSSQCFLAVASAFRADVQSRCKEMVSLFPTRSLSTCSSFSWSCSWAAWNSSSTSIRSSGLYFHLLLVWYLDCRQD